MKILILIMALVLPPLSELRPTNIRSIVELWIAVFAGAVSADGRRRRRAPPPPSPRDVPQPRAAHQFTPHHTPTAAGNRIGDRYAAVLTLWLHRTVNETVKIGCFYNLNNWVLQLMLFALKTEAIWTLLSSTSCYNNWETLKLEYLCPKPSLVLKLKQLCPKIYFCIYRYLIGSVIHIYCLINTAFLTHNDVIQSIVGW